MTVERSAVDAAKAIAFAEAGVEYAIGGALALAVAGVPRGTADVDINVFVPIAEVPKILEILKSLGIEANSSTCLARAKAEGMFVARWTGMRIDVFLPSIPFAHEANQTKVQIVDAHGWTGWFLSAEAITVFKLLFFRGKDVVDIERLIAVRDELDRDYVRRWLVEMMGEDDERVQKWDELVASYQR